jgi:hypothetical protein
LRVMSELLRVKEGHDEIDEEKYSDGQNGGGY